MIHYVYFCLNKSKKVLLFLPKTNLISVNHIGMRLSEKIIPAKITGTIYREQHNCTPIMMKKLNVLNNRKSSIWKEDKNVSD